MAAFQSRAVPSRLAVAAVVPSGLNAQAKTPLPCLQGQAARLAGERVAEPRGAVEAANQDRLANQG